MTVIRSALFLTLYVGWTLLLGILYLPLLLAPRSVVVAATKVWLAGLRGLARLVIGVSWRIEGLENLPAGPVIVAAKHQSAFDTFLFHALLDDPVYVLKRELFRIPLVGWYMRAAGMIGIDRGAGAKALRAMLEACGEALAEGRQIVIFPEGTRVAVGESRPYHPGVAALAARFPDVPVLPVTLNSGLLWGRKAFLKRPGTVTLKVLPAMEPGLAKRAFLDTLQTRIEEAGAALPHPGSSPL
jgi:1-acyl-sn-glycerol-3-phosphate acyltransferase